MNQGITKYDIGALAREASEAGDAEQYALCVLALASGEDGPERDAAITECERVIRDNRARAAAEAPSDGHWDEDGNGTLRHYPARSVQGQGS